MTDHERINELEARVVVLEQIVEQLHGGILDWASRHDASVTPAAGGRKVEP